MSDSIYEDHISWCTTCAAGPCPVAARLKRVDWTLRFAAKLRSLCNANDDDAFIGFAAEQATLNVYDEDPSESPEDAAEDEVSYWDADE